MVEYDNYKANDNNINCEEEEQSRNEQHSDRQTKRNEQKVGPIRNKGWIDSDKNKIVFRIISINPRGFGHDSEEKLEQLIKATIERSINYWALSLPDRKWQSNNWSKIKRLLYRVDQRVEMMASDSK